MKLKARQVQAALTATALAFGVLAAILGAATAAGSSTPEQGLRVGHTVERIVVQGSTLCPDLVADPNCAREPRQVDVHLWYPADQRGLSETPKTVYKSALYGKELIPSRWEPLSWSVEAEIARENAPIDPHGKAFPVIVFSHGSTNDPIDYAHTLELITGEGFVVAAPYHVNNTQDDVRIDFINTEASRLQPGLRLFDCRDGRPSPCSRPNVPFSMADRVRDISHILDKLPGWFGDRVDVSRAGVLGHSRGTVTALAAAGGSTQWGFGPEPRVKAIMGLAIGARAITFGANTTGVKVPTLLVAGTLDRNPGPAVSKEVFDLIQSEDKALVSVQGATHRTFDSTYCAQMQAAAAVADKPPLGDGDGIVEDSEVAGDSEVAKWTARAILDWHTVRGIVTSSPGGLSGKAVYYCSADSFTKPVWIAPAVVSIPGSEVASIPDAGLPPSVAPSIECPATTSIPPCTGLETEEVKQGVKELAVTFFGTVLKRVGKDGVHFTRYLAPKWLEKHESMVGSGNALLPGAEAFAGLDSICPPGQGVICED